MLIGPRVTVKNWSPTLSRAGSLGRDICSAHSGWAVEKVPGHTPTSGCSRRWLIGFVGTLVLGARTVRAQEDKPLAEADLEVAAVE